MGYYDLYFFFSFTCTDRLICFSSLLSLQRQLVYCCFFSCYHRDKKSRHIPPRASRSNFLFFLSSAPIVQEQISINCVFFLTVKKLHQIFLHFNEKKRFFSASKNRNNVYFILVHFNTSSLLDSPKIFQSIETLQRYL